jgi:hypothetical protein
MLTVILARMPVLGQDATSALPHPYHTQDSQASTPVSSYHIENLRDAPAMLEPAVSGLLTTAIQTQVQALQNEVGFRGAEIFWQMRRMHAANQAEEKQLRMRTSQDVAQLQEHYNAAHEMQQLREEHRQFLRGTSNHPRTQSRTTPMNASPYNPLTGAIQWPTILENRQFSEDRALVDAQFVAQNARHGVTRDAAEVTNATERMKNRLIQMVRQGEVNCQEYVAAKTFLAGVQNEARCAGEPRVANLAAN